MNKEKEIFSNWLSSYILELNLCPFAHQSVNLNKIQLLDYTFNNDEFIMKTFNSFLLNSPHNIESYFLLIPNVPRFNDFLEVFYLLNDITDEIEGFQNIKLVGFHPEYMHGEVTDDIEHYTNRCPLALIQLINKSDIEKRTKSISVESILEANLETLQNKGEIVLNGILYESKSKN